MNHPTGTPMCNSDNVDLRPMVKAHLTNPLAGTYIPSRDNPPDPIRPGAEDNKTPDGDDVGAMLEFGEAMDAARAAIRGDL